MAQNEGRGGKSPQAFRTISEVADGLEVPQHVLRFWESKFSQVKPLKRGGGRRYYRPEDVFLLRGIRNLLYRDGYTIRGVQKVLRESGAKNVIEAGRRDEMGLAPAPGGPAAEPVAEQVGPAQAAEPKDDQAAKSQRVAKIRTAITDLRKLQTLLKKA